MAENTNPPPLKPTEEQQTSHKKKAQGVVIALVGILVIGLISQSYLNMSKREERAEENRKKLEQAELASGESRPEAKVSDFERAQRDASQQQATAAAATAEEIARKTIADRLAASTAAAETEAALGAQPGKPNQTPTYSAEAPKGVDTPAQQAYALERQRVIAAGSSGLARASGSTSRGTSGRNTQINMQTNAAEIENVNARLEALSAVPAQVEARRREILEAARAAGIALPASALASAAGRGTAPAGAAMQQTAMFSGQQSGGTTAQLQAGVAAFQAQGGQLAQPVRPAAPNGQVFGELASNRAAGPQPGEEILPTGTILSAILDMDMNSDYLGNWIAVVQRPVYDPTFEYVLLPAGTKITGKSVRATGANENIANRMGAMPLWAIRPDGKRIDFRKTASMDASGIGALKDQVDRHFLAQFMGVAAYAVIGLGPSFGSYGSQPDTSRDAFVREFTSKGRDAGRTFAEKFLNIVPTQTIRHGTPVKIFIEDDIYITPWEGADEPHYHRR